MNSKDQVLEVLEDLGKDWKQFKADHNSQVSEIKADLVDIKERVYTPGFNGGPSAGAVPSEEQKAFDVFLRTGDKGALIEAKAWSATTGDAANAVPQQIAEQVERLILQQSPIRRYAKVVKATSGDYRHLVSNDDMGASWSSESATRSETATPTLEKVEPTGGELFAVVKVSRWFLEDATFDPGNFIISEAARQFAVAESTAFVSGNGTNRPTGFANGATSATADQGASPERAFGTYQHIASGVAADLPGDMLSSPQGDPAAVFVDTVAATRAGYLPNSAWYMNPSVKAAIIKKRDLNGRQLIESGLMGDPDRLLGYPIRIAEHLAAIAANSLPIWFGDMGAGYLVVDRGDLIIIRDEITTYGHVFFYLARRVYGYPCDTNSLTALKIATS